MREAQMARERRNVAAYLVVTKPYQEAMRRRTVFLTLSRNSLHASQRRREGGVVNDR